MTDKEQNQTTGEKSAGGFSHKYDTIFREYYSEQNRVDRFLKDPAEAIDVIIPVVHTNELWAANLASIYREIPVNRLLIGNGGCIDDSLDIANEFPRVKILDQTEYRTLGYSLRKLMEEVETEWFAYLHSDVYLPSGWFDAMRKHKASYDWFGCSMQHTVLVEYKHDYRQRPYAGAQMGKKATFTQGLQSIDDDYVYRQEDFVFKKVVEEGGGTEGRIDDTFHYHQTMFRPSKYYDLKVKSVQFEMHRTEEEQFRAADMQVRGVIKYLEPSPFFARWIIGDFLVLMDLKKLHWKSFKAWVRDTNPAWLKHISIWKLRLIHLFMSRGIREKLKGFLMKFV